MLVPRCTDEIGELAEEVGDVVEQGGAREELRGPQARDIPFPPLEDLVVTLAQEVGETTRLVARNRFRHLAGRYAFRLAADTDCEWTPLAFQRAPGRPHASDHRPASITPSARRWPGSTSRRRGCSPRAGCAGGRPGRTSARDPWPWRAAP